MKQEHAFDNLRNRRLKISVLDDLNDPFELLGLALKSREARRTFQRFKREMSRNYGLLCFSKRWHNPVLWAHYGDKHYGICLGFDVPTNHLKKINYCPGRLKIAFNNTEDPKCINDASMQKLLFTKYEDWAYEEEYRVYTTLEEQDAETGLFFKEFGPELQLKEVIVGPMCDVSYDAVSKTIDGLTEVSIIKSRLAFNSYRVVKNKKPGSVWRKNA